MWALERNLYELNERQRFYVHWHWKTQMFARFRTELLDLFNEYHTRSEELRELKTAVDRKVLKAHRVVGVTSTGAARHMNLIGQVKPRIVVIEEAAEMTEPQVTALLHPELEHLILVGDHKQLRPTTSDFTMARRFKLDISLFERLMQNNVDHRVLTTQRRMRPEISELIHPFYDIKIADHESVTKYDHVRGVSTDVFFFNHSFTENNEYDARSKSNDFEAEMVTGLCDYLLKQGYDPNDITVLTTYSGQFFLINRMFKEHMAAHRLMNVRRRVVDKFQGEENEIIILSLVRSNEAESAGFLKMS
eukprot:107770_1